MSTADLIGQLQKDFASGAHLLPDNDYNLVMLGTSGVGKTVYMTTMLHGLMTAPSGLRVEAVNPAQKNQLLDSYQRLLTGDTIPPTGRFSDWCFDVRYNNTSLFSFNWIDFRGGSVNWPEIAAGNLQDLEPILGVLRKPGTVAVFVLADAERFQRERRAVQMELAGIRQILERCLGATSGAPRELHLQLLLTKADAIALKSRWLFWRDWDRATMMVTCREVFDDIFGEFASRPEVFCDVIPLSAFGTSATYAGGNIRIKPGLKKIDSYQVEIPLRQTFRLILQDLQEARIPALQAAKSGEKQHHEGGLTWWNFWFDQAQRRKLRDGIEECDRYLAHLKTVSQCCTTVIRETEKLSPVCYRLGRS